MFSHTCHAPPWGFLFMTGRRRPHCPPPPGGPPPPHGHHHTWPPPWIMEMMGGPHRRAERGEVRYLILDAISDQARHGYEIIQTIEARSRGAYRPSPGTVYPTLQMLEEMGQARSREEGGRRVYEITEEGKKELEAHSDEVQEAYDRLGQDAEWLDGEDLHELAKRVRKLMRAIGQAFRRGHIGPRRLTEIRKVLEESMARIEEILRG